MDLVPSLPMATERIAWRRAEAVESKEGADLGRGVLRERMRGGEERRCRRSGWHTAAVARWQGGRGLEGNKWMERMNVVEFIVITCCFVFPTGQRRWSSSSKAVTKSVSNSE